MASWKRASNNSGTHEVFTQDIVKSQQDDREYRLIRLDNGLQAMLVHDAKADKAAASLNVTVGHLSDPDDMPGLAHFCEHLLFMGTEQFPSENEYAEYLAKNNGGSNAYTASSDTNYYFSVATQAFVGALERFSSFFHSPLFSPSCTTRELNAVDSEHKKNHQADMWRMYQLNKYLSKPGHPFSKFGSGTKDTLSKVGRELKAKGKLARTNGNASASSSLGPSPIPSRIASPVPSVSSFSSETDADGGAVGRETRRRLVEWWTKEYCASRMHLCVVGKESLDELAGIVSKLFSPIKNRGQNPLPMVSDHPFGPDQRRTLVSVQTIMSFHAVEISFPLAYQAPLYEHKPAVFLSHLIGHEGPGSLYSYLKSKGWVTSLSSGPQNLGRGFAMFKITISLTNDGFRQYRAVMLAAFKYLAMLRSSAFPAWHQKELATIHETRFRFAEKGRAEDYAVWVAEHLAWPLPRERVLSGPQLVWPWDDAGVAESEMRATLDGLRVDKGRAVLMAKAEEHAKLAGKDRVWSKEPIYGTEHIVEKLDEEFVKEAQGPNDIPDLFLPRPNEFLPTNLDVDKRDVTEPLDRPHLVRETPLYSLWHKKDDRFWVPKAHVIIDIRSPFANTSPRASVLTRLFADIVNDSLTEFSYDASLAGLSYNFAGHSLGVWVSLSGYNDKMAVLAKHVLDKIKNITVDPVRLSVMKEQAKRDWTNFFLGQSYRMSDYYGRVMLTEQQWTLSEKLSEVSTVTVEELQAHAAQLISKIHMRMLIAGNIYKDEAIKIADMTEKIFNASPLNSSQVVDRALILPEGSNLVWTSPAPNPNEPNSALTYYLHIGPTTDAQRRVTHALLTQILTEPAFNVLRTKEQLGYVVFCSQWILSGSGEAGIRIVVQSERGPMYLEERVECFLEGMKSTIEDMPNTVFEEQKVGLQKKWTEAVKNLNEEVNKYWPQIDSGYLDFYRRQDDAKLLQRITKEDVLVLFLSHVHPASPNRSKLAIQLYSQKPRPKHVSSATATAFESLLRASGIFIDDDTLHGDPDADEMTVDDFTAYWKGILGDREIASELLDSIPSLVDQYPAEIDRQGTSRANTRVVTDTLEFKKSLKVSEEPRPLVDWGDLPVSKF